MKYETLRNGVANLLAGVLPIFIIIFTTPYVVNTLGAIQYGLLTLITAIVGYFAIIDLNFTAGSLKYASEFHAKGDCKSRDQILTAGFLLYLLIGVVGGLAVWGAADWLVVRVFAVPDDSRALASSALRIAAFGFLLSQVQIYMQSIPQSLRRYDQSALLESIFGIAAPLVNVCVLWMGGGLYEIVLVRVIVSGLNIISLGFVVVKLLPNGRMLAPTRVILGKLAEFSGYAYLSRLAALAYMQGDKLIVGALLGPGPLTYYAVPFMLANRIYGLSSRMSSVILPAASSLAAINQIEKLQELYLYSARYIFYVNSVLTLMLVSVAHEILRYWIGEAMAYAGGGVLIMIAMGNLLDSLTNSPSLVNDGLGHPKVTGLFSIGRAFLGVCVVYWLVSHFGLLGAAIGQLSVSIVVPAVFLVFVHGRTVPVALPQYLKTVCTPSLPVILLIVAFAILRYGQEAFGVMEVVFLLVVEMLLAGVYGWLFVGRENDKKAMLTRLRSMIQTRRE